MKSSWKRTVDEADGGKVVKILFEEILLGISSGIYIDKASTWRFW